jgi:lipid-binding SYLF domain-containing protein
VKSRSGWGVACSVLVLITAQSPSAQAQRYPEDTVRRSIQVLSEITRNPRTGMPRLVLRHAQGIAIIPDMFKASFIFGARFGRGLLVVRQPDGTWSNPIFVQIAGGSFGAQAGAQSTDLVLVFQTPGGLERILKGKGKLTLGVDIGAAAGPVGKRFEAGTDLAMRAEILSYSNARGIFAGVSAEGGTLQLDWRANTLYYGRPVMAGEILAVNSKLAVPPSTLHLKQILLEKTAWPAAVAGGGRVGFGSAIIEDDEFLDSDAEVEVEGGTRQPRERDQANGAGPQAERRPKAQAAPADEGELEEHERAEPRAHTPASRRPRRPEPPNPEDLPEAVPLPDSASSKKEPRPKARPARPGDDDVPDLEPPQGGRGGASGF